MIESAVKRWWGVYQYPLAWKAQLKQESLCKPDAISPVGAAGLAQFMPATWRDMERKFGVRASPHSDIAIEWGAYYQARQMAVWKLDRTNTQRWRLGLAGYNAGTGNILKAQRKCDDARLWLSIKLCLSQVTGHNAEETKTYVERTERWWKEFAERTPWELAPDIRQATDRVVIKEIQERYDVRRYFNGSAWCSYWRPWKDDLGSVWITADHCHRQMMGQPPPYVMSRVVTRMDGVIDAVIYGSGIADKRPRKMVTGESVYILGYPAGSDSPSLRRGKVYIERTRSVSDQYSQPTTIILIEGLSTMVEESTYEPVTGGMSGGVVVSSDYEALAILVTQNGQLDLTGDGIPDNSADVVPLRNAWEMEGSEIIQ